MEAKVTPRKREITPTLQPQAVIQSPKQLQSQMERDVKIRKIIDDYIKNNMVKGKDYGSINIKGSNSKPSLFKPGAEKFCGLFKIRPAFRKDVDTLDMLGNKPGIIAYICELVDSRGRVIGEGRGTAKTNPDGVDFDINKQVKIAEKRAQVDAVLRTGGLSDFFTQDMEDMSTKPSSAPTPISDDGTPWTDNQRKLIYSILRERGANTDESQKIIFEMNNIDPKAITKKRASSFIKDLFAKTVEWPDSDDDTVDLDDIHED